MIGEAVILHWYREAHSPKGKSVFLEQMKRLVEWLQNAEEGSNIVLNYVLFLFFPTDKKILNRIWKNITLEIGIFEREKSFHVRAREHWCMLKFHSLDSEMAANPAILLRNRGVSLPFSTYQSWKL